jgi:excinuclease UvrABC nuclease subunit
MPFPWTSKMPYTHDVIEGLPHNLVGCYGLFAGDRCIYVGKGNIRDRLLDHLKRDNLCIVIHQPTDVYWVLAPEPDELEKQLITEHDPACNERVG